MKFSMHMAGGRWAFSGLGSLVVIVLIFLLPNLLAAPLDEERAEKELRSYLLRQLTQNQLMQMKASNLTAPDMAMATQWADDRRAHDGLLVESLKVRTSLLTPPFVSSRVYLVKADLLFPDQEPETRVWAMSVESRLSDFFWVAERPGWLWLMAR